MRNKDFSLKKHNFFEILRKVLLNLLVVVVLIIILFPIVWMIPSAFKTADTVFEIPVTWWPKEFTLENFTKLFTPSVYEKWDFTSSFFATLGVSASAVILSLFFNMLTAYVFARLEFRGKKFLWPYFLFSMFVPGITILLTSYKVVSDLKMLDTFWGLLLPGVLTSYNVFFFRQFFLSLPASLEEAADIDGLNPFAIFIRLFIPLAITPMIVQGASVFMGYWNSLLWPTLIITKETGLMQMMQIIRTLNERYPEQYGIVIAATLLSMVGPLVMFLFAQKKIIQGISITGLK